MTAVAITYQYKVFRGGRYLGDLPSVSSPFQYSLDINNGAAPLTINCEIPVYTANQAPALIETELGDPIQLENGDNFEMERQPDQYGANNSGLLLANDNDVIVYEFSPDYPNGKKVYSGWITKYNVNYRTGRATVNCISYGMDLNDYLIIGDASVDQSNTTTDNTVNIDDGIGAHGSNQTVYGQSFQVGGGVLNLSGVTVKGYPNSANTGILTLKVWSSYTDYVDPGGVPLASGTLSVAETPFVSRERFIALTTPLTTTPGQSLFFSVGWSLLSTEGFTLEIQKSFSVYANGAAYVADSTFDGIHWTMSLAGGGGALYDLYFKTYTTAGSISRTYSSYDPTNMVKNMVDNYVAAGGKVNYGSNTTDLTGLSLTYSFITTRILDGIKKALDLSPANFYWTVDPATGTLYYKQFATTASVLLTLGQNIIDLDIGLNAESVRNTVYFTGGPTAGVNLLKKYTDTTGLARTGRQRLETLTDNRVTISGTADQIVSSFLAANATEIYEITATVARNVIDITTLLPGQSVGLSGFGNFLDALVLYIVRIDRYPDKAILQLGSIPPRATSVLKELQNNVQDLNTLANPAIPS